MGGRTSDWKGGLERFLEPCLAQLRHRRGGSCADRAWRCKSIQPDGGAFAAGDYDYLHHFIAALNASRAARAALNAAPGFGGPFVMATSSVNLRPAQGA